MLVADHLSKKDSFDKKGKIWRHTDERRIFRETQSEPPQTSALTCVFIPYRSHVFSGVAFRINNKNYVDGSVSHSPSS